MKSSQQIVRLRKTLLAHYDACGRSLPWRIRPEDRAAGVIADPYKVWLSEIMCQQTTVSAVTPYWHKFLQKWPCVENLACAPRDEVLAAWAGLGYYARARNLHKCAGMIMDEFGGVFPNTEAGLLKLPGVGPYTAAAISSICYGEATNIVDGNVERVISRLRMVQALLPKARTEIRILAGVIADPKRAGDYGQALMDLGSQVCKPKNPKCGMCPWEFACLAGKAGVAEDYPKKIKKQTRPVRYGAVFYLENGGEILLRRRPDKGLLGGMMELPGTEWGAEREAVDKMLAHAPSSHNWQQCAKEVSHVFTHFTLYLNVFVAQGGDVNTGIWASLDRLDTYALPSLMRKAIRSAQSL
ncbi:MAG: A/G-specific adenine glycosylase [Robiginitomaculum sp.]|nr:MAG: A/G-specific adenine glycosylase [Robiginitomaculum sp.]